MASNWVIIAAGVALVVVVLLYFRSTIEDAPKRGKSNGRVSSGPAARGH